jgi:hypothetical protein
MILGKKRLTPKPLSERIRFLWRKEKGLSSLVC